MNENPRTKLADELRGIVGSGELSQFFAAHKAAVAQYRAELEALPQHLLVQAVIDMRASLELVRRECGAMAKELATVRAPVDQATKEALSARARVGAYMKGRNDPKQRAKIEAYGLWCDWQTGVTLHASGAAFQRYVLEQLPELTSAKTIERWCVRWRELARIKK